MLKITDGLLIDKRIAVESEAHPVAFIESTKFETPGRDEAMKAESACPLSLHVPTSLALAYGACTVMA